MVDAPHIIWPEHDWQHALANASAAGDERPTWGYQWPAGERLAAWLIDRWSTQPTENLPRRIIDLGCGRGAWA